MHKKQVKGMKRYKMSYAQKKQVKCKSKDLKMLGVGKRDYSLQQLIFFTESWKTDTNNYCDEPFLHTPSK
jgi:hypothetical protein